MSQSDRPLEALFVVGMHRSGTSLISRALGALGFSHGHKIMPARADNPDGFFEPLPVVQLNDQILRTVGANWKHIPTFAAWPSGDIRSLTQLIGDSFDSLMIHTWNESFKGLTKVICKDPRLSLTLPLWQKAIRNAGWQTRTVFIYRDPAEIVRSLVRREAIKSLDAANLVLDYWLAALDGCDPNTPIIRYDNFLYDAQAAVERAGFSPHSSFQSEIQLCTILSDCYVESPGTHLKHLRKFAEIFASSDNIGMANKRLGNINAVRRSIHFSKERSGQVHLGQRLPNVTRRHPRENRKIILHSHIFKNAGTSVDQILEASFGKRWHNAEFAKSAAQSNASLVRAHIHCHPELIALSTHTGEWTIDHENKLKVFPIIFFRHPILRIASAYRFERQQTIDTFGSQLARENDLQGYVIERLRRVNDLSFRNYQSRRLAILVDSHISDVESQAFRAIQRLPVLGLVEDFSSSVARFDDWLRSEFLDFKGIAVRANETENLNLNFASQLDQVRQELGSDTFAVLERANSIDIKIFERVAAGYPNFEMKNSSQRSEPLTEANNR